MEIVKKGSSKHQSELKQRVESLTHTKPDFGYPDQLDFDTDNPAQRGWGFFLDMIAKYRKREKISNTINKFNEVKKKWKEQEFEKISMRVTAMASSHHNTNFKKINTNTYQHPIVLKNTPQSNWLLWHFQKGKKNLALTPAEVRMNSIKKEAEKLQE